MTRRAAGPAGVARATLRTVAIRPAAMRAVVLRAVAATVLVTAVLLSMGTARSQADGAADPSATVVDRVGLAPTVAALLGGIDDHPALRAARGSVDAARAELTAVRFPVALEGEVSAQRPYVSATAAPGVPEALVDELLDDVDWTTSASVRARLRPFLVGDLADLGAQRRIAVARAERRLRDTRASLEAGALQSAAGLQVAEQGVRLAEAGLSLAREAAAATEVRVRRGAATEREDERAALEVARAEERLRAAQAARDRAEDRLADLVGPELVDLEISLNDLPDLPAAQAEDPAVLAAADDATLAAVSVGSARRGLLPTASASYAWSTDDGALSVSLESRTFQPTIAYDTPNPLSDAARAIEVPPLVVEDVRVDASVTLALSFELGAEGVTAVDAARARLDAAEAALQLARTDAERAGADRSEAVRAARADLAFARSDLELARQDAADVHRRVDLGLATPLDALRADLSTLQADLAALEARLDLLAAQVRGYRDLAVPLSEVLP